MMRVAVTSIILLSVWLVLSGKFDLLHVGVGVVTALALGVSFTGWSDRTHFRPGRFLGYLPWLIWQILLSNLRVAGLVLRGRMPIHPTFIGKTPGVVGGRALTTLGASITLTPGTLTVDVADDYIHVHALDRRSAEDIHSGLMARQVARVFEDRGA